MVPCVTVVKVNTTCGGGDKYTEDGKSEDKRGYVRILHTMHGDEVHVRSGCWYGIVRQTLMSPTFWFHVEEEASGCTDRRL